MPYKDPAKRLARAAERYRENPELFKARCAAYRAANPEKVKESQKKFYKEHKVKRNKEQVSRSRRKRLRQAGWTEERFDNAKETQQGRCAICGDIPEPTTQTGGKTGLVPDHKHSVPPVPRALLCSPCNTGLGMFKDNPDMLERAAAYLRQPW